MTEIGFSSSFERAFKKRVHNDKKLVEKFWQRLNEFSQDIFNPVLKTHKLSGELEG